MLGRGVKDVALVVKTAVESLAVAGVVAVVGDGSAAKKGNGVIRFAKRRWSEID